MSDLGIECDILNVHPHGRSKNQTAEHEELKHRALRWLAAQCRPKNVRGSIEIYLAEGYVADAFSICSLQHRFVDRYEWLWKLKERNFRPVIDEKNALTYEMNGDFENLFSCVFEVKVSRADFLSTFGKPTGKHANRHSPIGSLHWCCTPKGMIDPKELPEFWGLLEAEGRGMKEIKPPKFNTVERDAMNKFAFQLLFCGQKQWLQIEQCPACLNNYQK